tara:strand:+ start:2214 stop:2567 length:354 start_codon:yes stop_codon:yes gene_type:complete
MSQITFSWKSTFPIVRIHRLNVENFKLALWPYMDKTEWVEAGKGIIDFLVDNALCSLANKHNPTGLNFPPEDSYFTFDKKIILNRRCDENDLVFVINTSILNGYEACNYIDDHTIAS